jgi:hypothetical protein
VLTLFADLTAAGALSLGVSAAGLVAIPALLFADAHRADFDPRPAVHRAVESGRYDALLIAVTNTRHTATRLVLITLNVRDRARLAVIDVLLAAARHLNTPKGTR